MDGGVRRLASTPQSRPINRQNVNSAGDRHRGAVYSSVDVLHTICGCPTIRVVSQQDHVVTGFGIWSLLSTIVYIVYWFVLGLSPIHPHGLMNHHRRPQAGDGYHRVEGRAWGLSTEVSNLLPSAMSGRPKLVGQQRGNDEATRLPIAKAAFRPSVRTDSPFANSPSAFQSGMHACPRPHTLHTPYGRATIGRQWDRRRDGRRPCPFCAAAARDNRRENEPRPCAPYFKHLIMPSPILRRALLPAKRWERPEITKNAQLSFPWDT